MIWVSGEIADFRIPGSGHAYFHLCDKSARIAAVMFRGQLRHLACKLANGESIVALGRISVYEPRGTYQLILEYAESLGAGALQMSFEALKRKLFQEGLFDDAHKLSIPFLPHTLGVISSPTGAAVRDIINVIRRRFPNTAIQLYPVKVQGQGAAEQIVNAIELANRLQHANVIILARGGGSVEDLAPFNSEIVARAIHASQIPIVTGIGHEIDFTIADFAADRRAPTPSAAAELSVPVKFELKMRCEDLNIRCIRNIKSLTAIHRENLFRLSRGVTHPMKRIQESRLRVDDMTERMSLAAQRILRQRHDGLIKTNTALLHNNPVDYVEKHNSKVNILLLKLFEILNNIVTTHRTRATACHASLMALSPQAVMARGYSITRTVPDAKVLTDAGQVDAGQAIEILLTKGKIDATVK